MLVPVRVPERIKWLLEPLPLHSTPKQVGRRHDLSKENMSRGRSGERYEYEEIEEHELEEKR